MSDPVDPVAALRDRVEVQEKELEAAVRELGAAARHSVTPASWIRENALFCMTGALGKSEAKDGKETSMNETREHEQVIQRIREHPWMSVLGAAALGFVIARLLRGDR